MDRVQAVTVHVIRQPGRAAYAGDDDEVLARYVKFGKERLERGKDRVVTAAGAPSDLLVGLEVLGGQLLVRVRNQGEGGKSPGAVAGADMLLAGRASCVDWLRHWKSHPGSRRRARTRGTAVRVRGCRR